LCGLIFHPILGYLSDKIGRKKPIVIGGFIVAIGPLLHAFSPNWIWLIPGEILGTVDGGLWAVRQALFADSAKKESRGIGFASLFTIMQIGSIFMPTIGGILLDTEGIVLGMRMAFVYAAIAKIVQSIFNAKFLTEIKVAPKKESELKDKTKRIDLKASINSFFKPIITNKMLQVMLVGIAGLSFSMGLLQRFMVVYAVDIIGISEIEWGLVRSFSGIINLFTRIPFGRLADKYGRKKLITTSFFTRPISYAFFVFSLTFPQVLLSQSLSTLSLNMYRPGWQALVADLVPAKQRGRFYTTQGMLRNLLGNFSPAIGAFLWENYGPAWPFYTNIIILTSTAFFLYFFLKEPKIKEK